MLNNLFFVFFGFWQEKPVILQESFWQGCPKYFRRVQWNTYRANFSNGSLGNSGIFEKILKFSGQWRKNFQTWQNNNRCPREQFMKTFFQKRKIRSFFSDFEPMFTSSEIFRQSCETRNLCIRGSFWGKTIFEIYIIFHTFFGLWSKKRLVGKKIFSQVVTTAIRTSRGIFWEKVIFLKKKFCLFICFGVWATFLVCWQKKSGCQRNNLLIQKKVGGKNLWKNCFFKSFSDLEQKSLNN